MLEQHYGRKDDESEKVVKALFDELKLADIFVKYEDETHKQLLALIDEVDEASIPKSVFTKFLAKIFKRAK